MLSSLNNIVSNLHTQGVTHASRERERSQSHVESPHPQGAAPTSLERERSKSHVESQAQSATGSSDALVRVSMKRPKASRGRTYALSTEAARAREWSGGAREAPAQTAECPGLRGRCGIPDGGCSHPAQPASMQAHVWSSLVSEAAFDAALVSKDLATVQRAFDRFYAFRQRMEME
jgi:hypothetical protein